MQRSKRQMRRKYFDKLIIGIIALSFSFVDHPLTFLPSSCSALFCFVMFCFVLLCSAVLCSAVLCSASFSLIGLLSAAAVEYEHRRVQVHSASRYLITYPHIYCTYSIPACLLINVTYPHSYLGLLPVHIST